MSDISSFSDWWIRSLAVSTDGNTLATVAAPGEGTLRLWNLSTAGLEPARVLGGLDWATSAIAFSRDGRFVAAGTGSGHSHPNDGQILTWDLQQVPAKLISTVTATDRSSHRDVTALLFTNKDARMVSADEAGFIRTWTLAKTGEPKAERQFLAHPRGVQSLDEIGNGQLISSGHDGSLASWDIATGKLQRRWDFASQSAVVALAPSPEYCAVGLADGRVYILRLPTYQK